LRAPLVFFAAWWRRPPMQLLVAGPKFLHRLSAEEEAIAPAMVGEG
jgi:hypothetical protein